MRRRELLVALIRSQERLAALEREPLAPQARCAGSRPSAAIAAGGSAAGGSDAAAPANATAQIAAPNARGHLDPQIIIGPGPYASRAPAPTVPSGG